jgi:hypothetical protein
MRPLFADVVATEPDHDPTAAVPADHSTARRDERYWEWRRNRVVFMRPEADRMKRLPLGDLPPQRKGSAL